MHPATPSQSIPSTLTPTERVRAAFRALSEILPDYCRSLYASRAGKDSYGDVNPAVAGSCYPHERPQTIRDLIEGVVIWEPFEHPGVAPGCVAFVTRAMGIEGRLGLVEIETLPRDAEVTLSDPKGTGFVEAHVRGVLGDIAEHTVVILGEEQGREVAFTFHPGNPIPPSRVTSRGMAGRVVDPDTAMGLGLTLAKIVI